jgi:hypothetical protein
MRHKFISAVLTLIALSATANATIFSSVRGIVHDPQHLPVQGAQVTIKAKLSDWARSTRTSSDGQFAFNAVPIGEYSVTVTNPGFAETSEEIAVVSDSAPIVHIQLPIAVANQNVTVTAAAETIPTDSVTPVTLVSRSDIQLTPGADRANSLAMITDYVPGAYFTHDQLHVRGGHQVSWLVDGVPVPNTNIASNLGPQFAPDDIDYLEANRGSYEAEFGDRTYAAFNIAPRNGFERNNQGELITSFGNFYQTNDQLSFGSHTQRFAYYVSLNGNRSNLGLQTPTPEVVHDAENGYGGFTSLLWNVDPANQLRLVTSLRKDYYQIPFDPNPNDLENSQFDSSGFRDGQHESDAILNFSWVHTFNSKVLMTVSPFYHYNSANYDGDPNDFPVATTDHRSSNYVGGQATLNASLPRNDLQAGIYSFYQHDSQLFAALFNDQSSPNFRDRELADGALESFFLEDKLSATSWLTLIAGIRPTRFSGGINEDSVSPRLGAALSVPHLHWVLKAFYGNYYQAPPLLTASGPLLDFVTSQNLAFLPLHGERDREHQFGVTIPFRGWTLDADNFKTVATNFFDHNNVGESNIYFPITISEAVIRGWELTLRSPRLAHRAQVHLAYSNQIAEAEGGITGGLTNFSFGSGFSPLDHDQRNTLNVGGDMSLPWRTFASTNVYYGSGFHNAFPGQPFPGDYLPGHATFDLSLGKDIGERLSASVTALNVANRRVELDNSLTFGGFHWNNPREIYVQLRYRFHY